MREKGGVKLLYTSMTKKSSRPKVKRYNCDKCFFTSREPALVVEHYKKFHTTNRKRRRRRRARGNPLKPNTSLKVVDRIRAKAAVVTAQLPNYSSIKKLTRPKKERFNCEKCVYRSTSPALLTGHFNKFHTTNRRRRRQNTTRLKSDNPSTYKCDTCPRSYKKSFWLHVHKLRAHNTQVTDKLQSEKAVEKQKSKSSPGLLRRCSFVSGTMLRVPPCTICMYLWSPETRPVARYKQVRFLENNPGLNKQQHDKEDWKDLNNFDCSLCPLTFESWDELEDHIREHLGETPFKCKHCKFSACGQMKILEHVESLHWNNSTGMFEDC